MTIFIFIEILKKSIGHMSVSVYILENLFKNNVGKKGQWVFPIVNNIIQNKY